MAKLGSMRYQVQQELLSQKRFGEKKHDARKEEHTQYPEGIFSYSTYKTYVKECCTFADWVKAEHRINRLDRAKQFVPEYLERQVDRGLSPWTVKLQRAALSKLYHCRGKDWGVEIPERKRPDIARSRNDCERDKHFSVSRNKDLVVFLRGTGCRRYGAQRVRPCDIHVHENGHVTVDVVEKGGKRRSIPVLWGFEEAVGKYASDSKKPIWGKIHGSCDVHGYRREYAQELYRRLAREDIPKGQRYWARGDKKGQCFDRAALGAVSRALGHARLGVVVNNYL